MITTIPFMYHLPLQEWYWRRYFFPRGTDTKYKTKSISTYYVFHDRVTLFSADNFSTECRITMEFLHNFF